MFFWNVLFAIKQTNIIKKEKESGSFLVNTIDKQTTQRIGDTDFPKSKIKRILLCTSTKKSKAAVTVEASIVLPLFMFGMLCIVYLLEIMAIQMAIRSGIYEVAYRHSTENLNSSSISDSSMKDQLVEFVGETNLAGSILLDGIEGIDLSKSQVNYATGVVELCVSYQVRLPIPRFMDLGLDYQESVRFKRWTGYQSGLYLDEGQVVYITENQSVYHTRYNCSHLQLQVEMVAAGTIEDLRNELGGTYGSCGVCDPPPLAEMSHAYITTAGGSYHIGLDCSGLKRTITSVPLEEVIGKGVCQRCGS